MTGFKQAFHLLYGVCEEYEHLADSIIKAFLCVYFTKLALLQLCTSCFLAYSLIVAVCSSIHLSNVPQEIRPK